ncbi:MAG: MBL fold metallo-hydrolase [Candidatus Thorarchaeota archaeon]
MTAIRRPGKINKNTTLIDYGMNGVAGFGGVYLIEAGKSCLIDTGTKKESKNILKFLRANNLSLPDYVIITHSHYDHSQGVAVLRKAAREANHEMEVMASEHAIPLLKDQSFNTVYYPKETFENTTNVTPLRDGEILDLDGITLRMTHVLGHSKDQLIIFDEQNKNLFVGDALGIKIVEDTYIPTIMPPFFDWGEFHKAARKIGQMEYDTLCLAHFGAILGNEAKTLPEEAISVSTDWWNVLESAMEKDKLDDIEYVVNRLLSDAGAKYVDIELVDPKLKYGLKFLNTTRRIRGKKPLLAAEIFTRDLIVPWIVNAYKIYKGDKSIFS